MRIRIIVAALVSGALLCVAVAFASPSVAATSCGHRFGSNQHLTDAGGTVVQEWQISDLRRFEAEMPGFSSRGQVWEASATVRAVTGTVTPIIPSLYAVTEDGQRYPVLWQVASPRGLSASTLGQGQSSTGAIYFDVLGAEPMAVIYDNGFGTQLIWCCNGFTAMAIANCPTCADRKRP